MDAHVAPVSRTMCTNNDRGCTHGIALRVAGHIPFHRDEIVGGIAAGERRGKAHEPVAEAFAGRLALDIEGLAGPFQAVEAGAGIGDGLDSAIERVARGKSAAAGQRCGSRFNGEARECNESGGEGAQGGCFHDDNADVSTF